MGKKRGKLLDALGVSAFCESMALMTQSGIQPDEAVELLRQSDGKGGVLDYALSAMQAELNLGHKLADAMETCGAFPSYAVKMIAVGEESGRLEAVLFRLSRYYLNEETMEDKLRSAVTYPAVMLVMIIAVLALMLTMVLPAFTRVYERTTGSLAVSSYSYISWAYGFCWVALGVMLLLAMSLLIGRLVWRSKRRLALEGLLEKVPLCGEILRELGLYRFMGAYTTYLSSGTLQDVAMEESIKMTRCRSVEKKLLRCMSHLEAGHSFAHAAYDEGLFEPVYGRMLLAGERSGRSELVLWRLTDLLEEHCTTLTDRLVGIVDPLLSGVLLLTVGASLLSVMLPLLGIMNSIG